MIFWRGHIRFATFRASGRILIFLLLLLTVSGSLGWGLREAKAASIVTVFVNGQKVDFDVPPIIESGRVLVPFRGLFESVGAKVEWDPDVRTVRASRGETQIELRIGVNAALVNGRLVSLDVAPKIWNGRTLVPLRFVGESLGATVLWDPVAYSVSLNLREGVIPGENGSSGSPSSIADQKVQVKGTDGLYARRFTRAVSRQAAVATLYVFDERGEPMAQGSGFVVSAEGILVTNLHVIEGAADAVAVLGNGLSDKRQEVKVVGIKALDRTHDLAVLKLEPRSGGYPVIELLPNPPEAGDEVVALGAPRGFENTVSTGVVSHPSRSIDGVEYIQHTAPISHGSSGGPLLDLEGRALGVIVAAVKEAQNVNLAVPAKYVVPLLDHDLGLTLAEYAHRTESPGAYSSPSSPPAVRDPRSVGSALFPVVGSWTTSLGTINLSALSTFLADDVTTLLVGATLDSVNYLNWLLALIGGEEANLRAWLQLIGDLAAAAWQGPVFGAIFYSDTYTFYPSGFPPNEISLTEDGRWAVNHLLALFQHVNGVTVVTFAR